MLSRAIATTIGFSLILIGPAGADDCGRDAFASVVQKARSELSAINTAHKQGLQDKLKLLKDREGWQDSDYVARATPLVQDEQIRRFDAENKALLARVPELSPVLKKSVASLAGFAPSFKVSSDQRCAMLEELKSIMTKLVSNSRDRWAYLTGKVDTALTKAGGHAGGAQ